VATLKELQAEVQEGVASKKAELADLPPECTRLDLISYATALPTQFTLVFPSTKIKHLWEQDFLRVKEAADCQAPPSTSVAPPTSPLPVQMGYNHGLTFVNSMTLQSVRAGMQVRMGGIPPQGGRYGWEVFPPEHLVMKMSNHLFERVS
jgi:hypothetical protein